MPKKRRRRTSSRDLVHGQGIILEEIRSQNRVTIEAIEATRVALEAKIDQVDRDSQARDSVLEAAVRQNSADIKDNGTDIRKNSAGIRRNSADIQKNSADIQKNSADIQKNSADIQKNSADIQKNSDEIRRNSEDIRVLTSRVDALGPLDHRVSAIERRLAGEA
jgi:chromosome segregation ATPase